MEGKSLEDPDVPRIRIPLMKDRSDFPDDPFGPWTMLFNRMGPVVVVENEAADGVITSVWIDSKEEAKRVLESGDDEFEKGPQTTEPFTSLVPLHMIAVHGEQHLRLRKTAQSVLNDQIRDRMTTIVVKHSGRLREKLVKEGGPLVVDRLDRVVRSCALDIISDAIFNEPWGSIADYSETNVKAHALSGLMETLHWRVTDLNDREWRRQSPSEGNVGKLRGILIPYVSEHIKRRKVNPKTLDDGSLLSCWMVEKPDLSDTELENLCMTFLTMGHENISTAITWTLIQLAENPEAQDKVRREVLASKLFSNNDPTSVSWIDLNKLSTLEAAFLESSRLFPSVPGVTRICKRDTVVFGYKIPANTEIVFSLHALNRDKNDWGADANRFKCPRNNLNGENYWSFGAGARTCVGRPLSNIESKAIVGSILSAFTLESLQPKPTRPKNFISYRPGQHKIKLTPLTTQPKL